MVVSCRSEVAASRPLELKSSVVFISLNHRGTCALVISIINHQSRCLLQLYKAFHTAVPVQGGECPLG